MNQKPLFKAVTKYMSETGTTAAALAQKTGIANLHMSNFLAHGDFDFKLTEFVSLSLAVGIVPTFTFENEEE